MLLLHLLACTAPKEPPVPLDTAASVDTAVDDTGAPDEPAVPCRLPPGVTPHWSLAWPWMIAAASTEGTFELASEDPTVSSVSGSFDIATGTLRAEVMFVPESYLSNASLEASVDPEEWTSAHTWLLLDREENASAVGVIEHWEGCALTQEVSPAWVPSTATGVATRTGVLDEGTGVLTSEVVWSHLPYYAPDCDIVVSDESTLSLSPNGDLIHNVKLLDASGDANYKLFIDMERVDGVSSFRLSSYRTYCGGTSSAELHGWFSYEAAGELSVAGQASLAGTNAWDYQFDRRAFEGIATWETVQYPDGSGSIESHEVSSIDREETDVECRQFLEDGLPNEYFCEDASSGTGALGMFLPVPYPLWI